MSEKYYIEQGTEQDHFFIESEWHVICKVNTQLECICLGKGEAEIICRLLNEDEKRKILPKIDVDTDDMVSILGILENNISMILHLRPELGKTYNYDFVNRMKSKYYEKTRNLLGLE